MTDTVLIALISLGGTLLGSFAGIIASNKLVNHRIEQLEKKVEKHNNMVERMYIAEGRIIELENKIEILHKD